MRLVHTSGRTTCRMSISALPVPVVDDSDDGEIAGILLAAGGLAGGGAAHADHPVARHAADRVHRNLLGLPVVHHQQVFVFEPRNAVGRDQWLFDLADLHRYCTSVDAPASVDATISSPPSPCLSRTSIRTCSLPAAHSSALRDCRAPPTRRHLSTA